jgi:hypothetical protein
MPKSKSQVQKFREAARDLEVDDSEKRFKREARQDRAAEACKKAAKKSAK